MCRGREKVTPADRIADNVPCEIEIALNAFTRLAFGSAEAECRNPITGTARCCRTLGTAIPLQHHREA